MTPDSATHPVARFWNSIAEGYAAKPVADVPAWERKLEITKARLKPTDTVLDVGCGTGSLALELAPHVAQVHSMDISDEMIRIAREKAVAAGADNITFHVGRLEESLPFEAASFDMVCAYSILHLVDDRATVLGRLYEVLKPGGSFITSTACLGGSLVPYRPLLAVMRWLGKAPPVSIISHEQLAEEIRAAGFVDCVTPDVGATKTVAFTVASKPAS